MNTIRKPDENKEKLSNLVDLKKVERYKKHIKNMFVEEDVDKIKMVGKGIKGFIDIEYKKYQLTDEEYAILLQYLNLLEKEYNRKLKENTIAQEENNSEIKEEKTDLAEQSATRNNLDTYKIAIRNCFVWKDASKVKMVKEATMRILEKDYASHKIEKQEYDILLEYLQTLNQEYEKLLEEERKTQPIKRSS